MDNFKRLKKKYTIEAIVKSAVMGLGVTLLVLGVLLLSIKLSAKNLAWYFYLIIGIVLYGASSCATYYFIRPLDKKIAKRLDDDYDLHEKVQTMVEFDGDDSEMLVLQRNDAESHLENLPQKKFSLDTLKRIWQYIVVCVVGLSLFIAGTVVPSRYIPSYDDGFNMSAWDIVAFQQMIENIKNDENLENKVKVPMVENLELLFEELKETTTSSSMRKKVKASADAIDEAVILANTYREILLALNSDTALDDLKISILKSTTFYKNEKVDSYDRVKSLYSERDGEIREALKTFTDALEKKVGDLSIDIEIKDAVETFLTSLNDSVGSDEMQEKFNDSENPDSIYTALSIWSTNLGPVVEDYMFTPIAELRNIVSDADADYLSAMTKALGPQVYNKIVNEYVFNTLSSMFKVNISPEELVLPGISDDTGSSGGNTSHGGSIGSEDVNRGGDDQIYDPDLDKHVEYGEVWNDYMAKLYARLNDPDSEMSDEMKNYIIQYIKALNGDNTDTGEEQ